MTADNPVSLTLLTGQKLLVDGQDEAILQNEFRTLQSPSGTFYYPAYFHSYHPVVLDVTKTDNFEAITYRDGNAFNLTRANLVVNGVDLVAPKTLPDTKKPNA
jgi:hypothetical protein